MSHAAADVIFRTLFSIPIEHDIASQVFTQFRDYQRTQPILNLAAFLPLPRILPRGHRRKTKATAKAIRGLITRLTAQRMAEIKAGTAPDDLATKIMTTPDPETGRPSPRRKWSTRWRSSFLRGTRRAPLRWPGRST